MNEQSPSKKILNILTFIFQGLLFLILGWAGIMKLFKLEELPFPWIKDHPNLVLLTAAFDLLGSIGIILPAIFGLKCKVTVSASIGIILLMLSAIVFHIRRNESGDITFNIFLIAMAAFIIWNKTKQIKS